MRKALLAAALAGLSFAGLSASNAQAESIVMALTGFSITPAGTGGIFNYPMELDGPSIARTGDFFVIFDFKGFIPGSNVEPNGDWSFTAELVSAPIVGAAGTLGVTDSATITNLRWTRTGADLPNNNIPLALGTFSAGSTAHAFTTGGLGARDFSTSSFTPGVRVNSDIVPVPVPLPAAAWGGMALLGALGAARMRKAAK
jgi:hypothetical protein